MLTGKSGGNFLQAFAKHHGKTLTYPIGDAHH